jgi:hypothetical protein
MEKTKRAIKQLEEWSNSLNYAIKEYGSQIINALKDETKLPENCPSRASLADLISGQIYKKLDEVNAAYKDLINAIWEEGKNK